MPSPRVGYVLSNFPVLSETFVLHELLELEAQGLALEVFSVRRPPGQLRHEDVGRLRAPVTYVPGPLRLLGMQRRIAATLGPEYRRQRIRVAARGPRETWRFLQAGFVAHEARRRGLTHLHAHFAHHPALVAMYAAQLAGISFSFTAHAMDLYRQQVDRRTLIRKLAAARFVVTVSEYNAAFLQELAPEVRDKLVLVRSGIDLERFAPSPPPAPRPFRILCVARLVEKKGIGVLIAACRELKERGRSFRCDVIGEGRLRPALEALIRQHQLGEVVQLRGAATHEVVREHYRAAHAFVLPCVVAEDGDRDGLPVSLLEAMACGLAVVTTPVTGIPEVLRDGENGLLVPPGDPAALADAIARLMDDPALAHRLGAKARPVIAAGFDRRRTVAALRERLA
jgi:glycosyltransferase involved in cell wall biosynthesis